LIRDVDTKKKKRELDLSAFPPGTVTEYSTLVCLACTFDIFTTQLGLAPRTAYSEIRKYSPTIAELTARKHSLHSLTPRKASTLSLLQRGQTLACAARYLFVSKEGKATDAARRQVIKSLPQKDNQFQVIEAKTDKRAVLSTGSTRWATI